MRKERKNYTAEEKVAILKRHLVDKEPISRLCDELGLQPTVFYRWQKEFFENGAAAFQTKARPNHQAERPKTLAQAGLGVSLRRFGRVGPRRGYLVTINDLRPFAFRRNARCKHQPGNGFDRRRIGTRKTADVTLGDE